MRLLAFALAFLVGAVFGALAIGAYWHWHHNATELWVTTQPMRSSEGISIPAGTVLVFGQWMPEGYAALELSLNVEGSALEKFNRQIDEKNLLRVPYWIDGGSP